VEPDGNGYGDNGLSSHSVTIRSSIWRSLEPGSDTHLFLVGSNAPVGCHLLCCGSIRRGCCRCAGSALDRRFTVVRTARAVHGDSTGQILKRSRIRLCISTVGDTDEHSSLHVKSSTVCPLHSCVRCAAYCPLFCPLFFDFGFQR